MSYCRNKLQRGLLQWQQWTVRGNWSDWCESDGEPFGWQQSKRRQPWQGSGYLSSVERNDNRDNDGEEDGRASNLQNRFKQYNIMTFFYFLTVMFLKKKLNWFSVYPPPPLFNDTLKDAPSTPGKSASSSLSSTSSGTFVFWSLASVTGKFLKKLPRGLLLAAERCGRCWE